MASIHSFVGDESFCAKFEAVGIAESDFSERCASTGIVDDFLDNTTEVTMSFRVLSYQHDALRGKEGNIHRELGIWLHPFEDGCATGKYLQIFCTVSFAREVMSGCGGTSVRG